MRRSLLLPALAKVKWFYSPSGNISCEVSSGGGRGAYPFCQSVPKPRAGSPSKQGTLKVCHGTKCLGDGPEEAFELGYGKSVTVGNFKCTSRKQACAAASPRRASGRTIAVARTQAAWGTAEQLLRFLTSGD